MAAVPAVEPFGAAKAPAVAVDARELRSGPQPHVGVGFDRFVVNESSPPE